jgi:hypothetical protein
MAILGTLPALESLVLPGGLNLSDRGLRALAPLASLESLHLSQRVLSAPDAAALAELPKLSKLYVYGIVGDETLRSLGGAKSLASLTIGPAGGVTGEGLRIVRNWHNLAHLAFASQTIDEQSLLHLAGMKSLKTLAIQTGKLTPAGRQRLEQALPDCRIDVIDPL